MKPIFFTAASATSAPKITRLKTAKAATNNTNLCWPGRAALCVIRGCLRKTINFHALGCTPGACKTASKIGPTTVPIDSFISVSRFQGLRSPDLNPGLAPWAVLSRPFRAKHFTTAKTPKGWRSKAQGVSPGNRGSSWQEP